MTQKHYGKYRGSVTDNNDLKRRGRIRVKVAHPVGVSPTVWAEPCLPFGNSGCGFFTVPEIGADVWVEFEAGDINQPIWTGCFWTDTAVSPDKAPPVPTGASLTVQLPRGVHLVLSDDPSRGITLGTADGAKITINQDGIVLDNGKGATIELKNNSVDLNKGALKVS